jgi:hypothetical protein
MRFGAHSHPIDRVVHQGGIFGSARGAQDEAGVRGAILRSEPAGRLDLAGIDHGHAVAREPCQFVSRGLFDIRARQARPFSYSLMRSTFGADRPPWYSDDRNARTIDLASSAPITRAPIVTICASLLIRARSAE